MHPENDNVHWTICKARKGIHIGTDILVYKALFPLYWNIYHFDRYNSELLFDETYLNELEKEYVWRIKEFIHTFDKCTYINKNKNKPKRKDRTKILSIW